MFIHGKGVNELKSLGGTVSPVWPVDVIHHDSSWEGLYETHTGTIGISESLELASPSQGRRPGGCGQFSLWGMLGVW